MNLRGSRLFTAPAAGSYTFSTTQEYSIGSNNVFEVMGGTFMIEVTSGVSNLALGALGFANKVPTAGLFDVEPATRQLQNNVIVAGADLTHSFGLSAAGTYRVTAGSGDIIPFTDPSVLVEDFTSVLSVFTSGAVSGRVSWLLSVKESKRDLKRINAIQDSLL